MKIGPGSLKDILTDHFSNAWKLLSETSAFLGKTPVFSQYEEDLRCWRRDLQNAGDNTEIQMRIRKEITELRKSLRLQGYDLSLAKQNLVLDGFRNDASLGEGFRRVVIFFCDDTIYWLSGDENHITLSELLEQQLSARTNKQRRSIRSRHYLWYCRKGNNLILSGSDTETKDDYERLKAMASANSLVILAKLRGLQ